jgi:hypothetical protein
LNLLTDLFLLHLYRNSCFFSLSMSTKIPTLDLFSGVGGFSMALRDVCKTVGYCDTEPTCRMSLKRNISRGLLDDAQIYEDVKSITSRETAISSPQLITAGFPCTDISIANVNGEGIRGSRSGLFFEIMRIVDETPSVQALFLENSHAILKRGFHSILRALRKRDFQVLYCITNASDVGALHRRKRWYCLCVKKGFADKLNQVSTTSTNSIWNNKREPCSRLVKKPKDCIKKQCIINRCRMLGNSIVPQCAAHAWNTLVNRARDTSVIKSPIQVRVECLRPVPSLNLEITDGENTFHKKHWATPCYSIWHIYSHITSARAKTVLTVQMFYEKKTIIPDCNDKRTCYRDWLCNPRFIEYLMGYPKDWTRYE